ncbi:MAG: hypothetical protein RL687_290, partial [Candidatus Parcubacteria bacterium]
MITLDLVEFIEKEEKSGASREKIKSELLSAGWLAEDIEEGFQKVVPAFVVPKTVETVAPKIQTTFTPATASTPVDTFVAPQVKVENAPVEIKKIETEIKPTPVETPVIQKVEPIVSAPAVSIPEEKIEIVKEPEAEIKIEAPKIDPYREVVKEDKPIENSFSASVPPSNLPKIWTPSNIPIISTENTEVIPRLIPKKVEPIVPPKAVLPPVRTPERKAELAKVYQQPPVVPTVAPMASVMPKIEQVVPQAINPALVLNVAPAVLDMAPVAPAAVSPAGPVVIETAPAVEIKKIETPIAPPVVNIAPTVSAPSQKPPYMVFAKQELSKPISGPASTPYSPNIAVTSSFPRDTKNFIFEEKKPGVPRFIVGVFIFVAIACIFGGLAFAYMTGLINIPFLPKVNQTAVTAKYIDPIINEQNNSGVDNVPNPVVPVAVNPNENTSPDLSAAGAPVPSVEDLKNKDKNIEENISNIELQIYKKYA